MATIIIKEGDITTAPVTAIVNAANAGMLGGGGVDGAIHRAAGPGLFDACRSLPAVNGIRCPAGEAKITPGFDLQATYIIHTVGPRYNIDPEPEVLLALAYESSLKLALENQCESIAFPAIACGAYGYPAEEAAKISLSVCSRDMFNDIVIYFYLFSGRLVDIWTTALDSLLHNANLSNFGVGKLI